MDWLGRAEHFQEDLAALVQLLNARPGVPRLPVPGNLGMVNVGPKVPCSERQHRRWLGKNSLGERNGSIFNPCDPLDHFR